MNFLICSKLSIPAKDRTLPAWQHLRALGHNVWVEHPKDCPGRPDAIISMGVSIMDETFEAMAKYPHAPLFPFNWDCYEWIWEKGADGRPDPTRQSKAREGEYDYVKYGTLLKQAREVWVPSICTGRRNEQWWGVKNNHVILSSCPWWDGPKVRDDGFALCTLRHLPDPWDTEFERACDELKIPYLRPDHGLERDAYEDAVAGCRFLVSHYFEASTGGLTLLEGYRLGKPVLISDSEWHGGRDYFGNRARYFRWGDFEHFKHCLKEMWERPEAHRPPPDCKRWIEQNFSDEWMVERMLARVLHANAGAA